jgi:hypothetical protein
MIEKERVFNNLGSGWHSLIEQVYAIQDQLSFCDGVYTVERKHGMMHVIYSRTALTSPEQEFILKAIEYKFERLTAKLCETCGQYGVRRKELPETKTLCTRCYAFEYSELHPTPSKMAYPEPQKEY